jgi:ubiquitin-protein ligase
VQGTVTDLLRMFRSWSPAVGTIKTCFELVSSWQVQQSCTAALFHGPQSSSLACSQLLPDASAVRAGGFVWSRFDVPATYPAVAPEIELPELEGKTAKMYRGGKICLTIHFKPLWAKNRCCS